MKEFLTYEKQYKLLVDRQLQINDKPSTINILKNEGYYNLINGYSKFFQYHNSDIYIKGATFNHIVALYTFDQELRSILYKFTSIIECHVKAVIGHEFSRIQGIDHNVYLSPVCFTADESRKNLVDDLIKNCQEAIKEGSDRKSNRCKDYILHYSEKYEQIPLWVLVRALSFGVISKFYSLMQDLEKDAIAKEFGLTSSQFSNILKIIVRFRNKVAHGERTFCAHTRETLSYLKVLQNLSLPRNRKGEVKCGKRDILALLICCKYLLNESDFESLVKDVQKALSNLEPKISNRTMMSVLDQMGLKSLYHNLISLIKVKK